MFLLTIPIRLVKWCGIIVAEAIWFSEIDIDPSIAYYTTRLSVKKAPDIATQYVIDYNNPEKVTKNLFDYL